MRQSIPQLEYICCMLYKDTTVAALATPPGRGALAVIRLSGPDALNIAARCFSGTRSPSEEPGGRVIYGRITDQEGQDIDDVLLSVFRAPHSFTGEDSVEISCHGNPLIAQKILQRLFQTGAHPAEAGEYSRRAFLNGKLDLAQAEAVADIIHASSEAALRGARGQLDGLLSAQVGRLREALLKAGSLLELELDFSEEDVEFVSRVELLASLEKSAGMLQELAASYRFGKVVHDGVHVAIAGPPNVGKSSLLNFFLKEKRAIVSPVPGTTRDLIREEMTIDGFLFILSDTAGLRDSDDLIEQEGVRRSRAICREADLILFLSDPGSDGTVLEEEIHGLAGDVPVLKVRNKADLESGPDGMLSVSALTGDGMNVLLERMKEATLAGWQYSEQGALVTSLRHRDALLEASSALERAREALESGMSGEFVALDIRSGMDILGEIIGKITTDDMLNAIFSGYCIGK